MEIAFGAKTDVGLKRVRNEDSLCADSALGLYLVCDGLGGRDAGDVASRLAVDVISKHLQHAQQDPMLPLDSKEDERFSPPTNRLASGIRLANRAIYDAAHDDPNHAGMATTVVAAVVTGEVLSVAHVGDSRLYLLRGETIRALTADHSLVAEQVRRGTLTEEEAERSPQRHIVTRALGINPEVEVELDEIQLLAGDTILLCSDGLTRGVKPPRILEAVRAQADPQAAADALIAMATEAGGEDNTTVILVRVHSDNGTGFLQRFRSWFEG
jgi:protein phosphatase